MPTDDPQNFDRRLQKERDRLEESTAIHEADRDPIQRWLQRKDGTVKTSSLEVYLRRARIASERSDVPLVEMDEDDFHSLVFDLRHEYDLADGTIDGYEAAVLMLIDDMTDAEWPEDVERTTVEAPTVDPDTILTPADIQTLTSSARHQRDVAFVEFLADTGVRLSLALSLRVCDVDLTRPPTYTPNPKAEGLKGATVAEYPLIDSAAAIRSYLRTSHPRPDDPEAALFHKLHPSKIDSESDERWGDDGGLAPNAIRQQLHRVADRAGVDKPTNPHAFRHAAITRMVREGYSRSQIEHRVHWTLDTDMWEVYEHITGTEHTEDIFREAGLVEGDDAPEKVRKPCGNCGEPLGPHHDWCLNCGQPVTAEAEESFQTFQQLLVALMANEQNPTTRRELGAVHSGVSEHPDAVADHNDPS